jgi:hypothetical protein
MVEEIRAMMVTCCTTWHWAWDFQREVVIAKANNVARVKAITILVAHDDPQPPQSPLPMSPTFPRAPFLNSNSVGFFRQQSGYYSD